jgi:hypothetical protein
MRSIANIFSTDALPGPLPVTIDKSVLDDIEALRTMLTILSQLQPNQPKASLKQPPTPTDLQSKECKVLSALATVLVMQYEKVAVVAKYGNSGWLGGAEVFACTDSIAADRENTKSFIDSMKNLWNFVTTENPRRKRASLEGPGVYPEIIDPKVKSDHLNIPRNITEETLLDMLLRLGHKIDVKHGPHG